MDSKECQPFKKHICHVLKPFYWQINMGKLARSRVIFPPSFPGRFGSVAIDTCFGSTNLRCNCFSRYGSNLNYFLLSDYDQEFLHGLLAKAEHHAINYDRGHVMVNVHEFFRNKPSDYFNYIDKHRRRVMEVYPKDINGQRGNPINNRLNGLFFSVVPAPKNHSFFGNDRLFVPSSVLFNKSTNLYFADFYCNNIAHYITLVIAKPHTEADAFCNKHLCKLDIHNNPFLIYTGGSGTRMVKLNRSYHTEVFYTENLNLTSLKQNGSWRSEVPSSSSSTPGGLPRYKTCSICDI